MQKNKKLQEQSAMNPRRQILSRSSHFAVLEAYKTLRTNIRFTLPGRDGGKFCITSSISGEGKSITILNLAISFAEAGRKVLLIDADMRRPALARLLIEKASPGLSNVLAGMSTVEQAVRRQIYPNLDILFSGDISPNPSELLGSKEMEKLVEKMSREYDYILIDTPPVTIVSDACIIANLLDGVLYLVRQNRAEKKMVADGISQLQLSGAKLLGFIFNGVEAKKHRYDTYSAEYYRRPETNAQEKEEN